MKKKTKSDESTTTSASLHDAIDEASEESFPTSDPPAWTLGADHEMIADSAEKHCDITHILSHEHHIIRKLVTALNKLIESIELGTRIDITLLKNVMLFLTNFVEQCHHTKEDILFPILKHGKDHPSYYLLHDLKHEHEYGRKLLSRMEKLITLYSEQDKSASQQLTALLKEMQNLHLNHIAKEEEYVFPLINKLIAKSKQKELLKQFEEIESHVDQTEYESLINSVEAMNKKV